MLGSVIKSTLKFVLILCVILLPFAIIFIEILELRAITSFGDLPSGAVDNSWSARAVEEDHPHLANSIEHLAERVPNIVRVLVVSEQDRFDPRAGRGPEFRHRVTEYTLRVLDVYKGEHEVGDYITAIQMRRIANSVRRYWRQPSIFVWSRGEYHHGLSYIEYIRIPIFVGDDLILFLGNAIVIPGSAPSPPRLHNIQGVYRYTLQEFRGGYDNWVFESVNPHNPLVLTEADLQRLREYFAANPIE